WRGSCSCYGDEQDLPHDGADRPHLRRRVWRQLFPDEGKALSDLLSVSVDVRPPIELHIDDRKTDTPDRTHAGGPGRAIHLRFDRERDELLNLGRREPFSLRHDRDSRLVEVGKDIHRQSRDREQAVDDEGYSRSEHEEPVSERLGYKKSKH